MEIAISTHATSLTAILNYSLVRGMFHVADIIESRLTIVSHEAKKVQVVCNE